MRYVPGVLAGVAPVQVQRITFDEIRRGSWAAPAAAAAVVPPEDPAPGERPADTRGFWLQLGAFRQRDSAVQLQQRLLREAAGLPGVALFDEAGLVRVMAGPWAGPNAREAALAAAEAVQRQTGLAGVVVERRP